MYTLSNIPLTDRFRLRLNPEVLGPARMWLQQYNPKLRIIHAWDLDENVMGFMPSSFGAILAHNEENGHRLLIVKPGIRLMVPSDVVWIAYDDLALPFPEKIQEFVRNALSRTILPFYRGTLPLVGNPDVSYKGWEEPVLSPVCPMADV